LIGQARHTKAAQPPAMAQPIVWVVQLIPSSLKKVDSSMATVFSAGHSGRGMREDWAKGCVAIRSETVEGALDPSELLPSDGHRAAGSSFEGERGGWVLNVATTGRARCLCRCVPAVASCLGTRSKANIL